jgi:hypothetical protein
MQLKRTSTSRSRILVWSDCCTGCPFLNMPTTTCLKVRSCFPCGTTNLNVPRETRTYSDSDPMTSRLRWPCSRRSAEETFRRCKLDLPSVLPAGLSHEFAGDLAKQKQWTAFLKKNRLDAAGLADTVAVLRESFAKLGISQFADVGDEKSTRGQFGNSTATQDPRSSSDFTSPSQMAGGHDGQHPAMSCPSRRVPV